MKLGADLVDLVRDQGRRRRAGDRDPADLRAADTGHEPDDGEPGDHATPGPRRLTDRTPGAHGRPHAEGGAAEEQQHDPGEDPHLTPTAG